MKRILTWIGNKLSPGKKSGAIAARPHNMRNSSIPVPSRPKPKKPSLPSQPEMVDLSSDASGSITDGGPNKNVLIRNRYVREETGTHDTLKIIDDSILESPEEDGAFDPYNTGRFDRAKSWDSRKHK